MEKEEKRNKLPIFENCPSKEYVIMGFTSQDLAYTATVIVMAVIAGIVLSVKMENTLPGVFIGLFFSAAGIIFFRRDRYMENCVDKIRIIYRYHRSVKQYEYTYVNIYEKVKES